MRAIRGCIGTTSIRGLGNRKQEAIALLIEICRTYGNRIHIVHLASADAVPMLRKARAEGLPITVETCPHYLAFAAEDIADGATEFKCAPPIRERENAERLWAALEEGVIDLVATDHSPCPPSMKAGDFATAWGGIASLQLSLAIMWRLVEKRGLGGGTAGSMDVGGAGAIGGTGAAQGSDRDRV